MSSYLLFGLGWALFGLGMLRARTFPVVLSVAVTVTGLIGLRASAPPYAIPLGLALAALGIWIVRAGRGAR